MRKALFTHTHREDNPHRNGEEGQQNSYRRTKARYLLLCETVNLEQRPNHV